MSDLPLSRRVKAPAVNQAAEIDGVTWRSLTIEDVDALVEANRAIASVDHPNWAETGEEILEELEHSHMQLTLDSLAAVTADGEIISWGLVIFPPTQQTLVRSILVGGVVPAHRGRGIGRALLAWQQGRALQQLATSPKTLPGWIVATADARAITASRTIERAGLTPRRWFIGLSRVIAEPVSEVGITDGVRIVNYAPQYSAAAHAARNDAFQGHGASQPMNDEQWSSMVTMSTAAHQFSFIALDSAGAVVGLLMTIVNNDDWPRQGYSSGTVWVLGVIHTWRRRGIARALLTAHLGALQDAAIERSDLDVASDSSTGIPRLYTDLGYVEQNCSVNYVREH